MDIAAAHDSLEQSLTSMEALRRRNYRGGSASPEISLDAFAEVFAGIAAAKVQASPPPEDSHSTADSVKPNERSAGAISSDQGRDRPDDDRGSRIAKNDQTDDSGQTETTPLQQQDKPDSGESGDQASSADGQVSKKLGSEISRESSADIESSEQPLSGKPVVESELTSSPSTPTGRRDRGDQTPAADAQPSASIEAPEKVPDQAKPVESKVVIEGETKDAVVAASTSAAEERPKRHARASGDGNDAVSEAKVSENSPATKKGRSPESSVGIEAGKSAARSFEVSSPNASQQVPKPAAANVAAMAASSVGAAASSSSSAIARSSSNSVGQVTATRPVGLGGQTTLRGSSNDRADAKSPTPVDTSETISRVKLVQRVAKAFAHLRREGGRVRMRLAPEALGTVTLDMRVQKGRVDASVIAESEAAATTLREHLPELRSRLESSGLQVDRLEVRSERDGERPQQRQPKQQQGSGQQSRREQPQKEAPPESPTAMNLVG